MACAERARALQRPASWQRRDSPRRHPDSGREHRRSGPRRASSPSAACTTSCALKRSASCRVAACAFIHDEVISDCKEADSEEVRSGQEVLMIEAGQSLVPEIKWSVASVAMYHWSKKAKALWDGRRAHDALDKSH